jgi:ribosomal protein S18 acetylase RimI-like enzyme
VFSVRHARAADVERCVAILRQLPDYFTPDTYDEVRASIPHHRAWVAVDIADDVAGFVLVVQRYARSAEITFASVRPDHRRAGIGTALVEHALDELARDGIQVVEAKTLDASAGYEPYVATRSFWEARGFVQIDCIDPLPGWQPGNPSAIYVAALTRTT